jgi:pimeloyl-ACP methyl ester carboxylesterase
MQKIILRKRLIIAFIFLMLFNFSCSKEEINYNNLNETFFVRHKNADMPAHVHGNGSEKVFLIILHGGPGGSGIGYRGNTIRSEIEKNNAVVYFDQRGSGSSQGNYTDEDVSIDIMAEDVLALTKVIRAKFGDDSKLFLMGHSWGGTLGPAVLLKNQDEFLGWIDVAGYHDPIGTYEEYKMVLTQSANEQIALGNSID